MKKHVVIIGLLGLVAGVWQMSNDLTVIDAETLAVESAVKRERNHRLVDVIVLDATPRKDVCQIRTGKYPLRKRVNPHHLERYFAGGAEGGLTSHSRLQLV